MRHNEAATVEHVVARQSVDEGLDLLDECGWLVAELGQAFGQTVRHLHVATVERFEQFDFVVAGHAQRCAGVDHGHDEPQHLRHLRPAIHQIAQEDRPAAVRRCDRVAKGRLGVLADSVAELVKQLDKLVEAPVNVADQIKRAMLVMLVAIEWLAHDVADSVNFLG